MEVGRGGRLAWRGSTRHGVGGGSRPTPRVGGPGGRKAGEEEWGREGRVLLVALGELFPKKFSGWGGAGDLIKCGSGSKAGWWVEVFF